MNKTFRSISIPDSLVISNEGMHKICNLSYSARNLLFEIIKQTNWNNIYFNYNIKNKHIKELIDNNLIFTTEIKHKYKINNTLYHCCDPKEYYDENDNLHIRTLDDNENEVLISIENSK